MNKAIIYVHGKNGSYKEAEDYIKNCDGYDIIGVDYDIYLPWLVKEKILELYTDIKMKYESISLIANSIGAYFSMNALQNCEIEQALFISPILDMEKLILDMLNWAGASEKELLKKQTISTDFGETLSWEYLKYVRDNPIKWQTNTKILYAKGDNLTLFETANNFALSHNADLTVMENGEHWFHTPEQIEFLDKWMSKKITH